MPFVLFLTGYIIVGVILHLVGIWFKGKENDIFDWISVLAYIWPALPFLGAGLLFGEIGMFLEKKFQIIERKLLDYKTLRKQRRIERKEAKQKYTIILPVGARGSGTPMSEFVKDSTIAMSQYNATKQSKPYRDPYIVEKDPLLIEAEQEVEALLNEGKL